MIDQMLDHRVVDYNFLKLKGSFYKKLGSKLYHVGRKKEGRREEIISVAGDRLVSE